MLENKNNNNDSCYRIKTEGNHDISKNNSKVSVLQDWKSFFHNFSNEGTGSMKNINQKPFLKKENEVFIYKDEKDDKESENSIEVAKNLFLNLKTNDLVNVFEDKNNNSSLHSNNITNSSDFSGNKTKLAEIPSEKKNTQIKVFTTHNHSKEVKLPKKENLSKKNHLQIKIEKINENINSAITANKVRESKEFHNITQLNNESTKNKNRKRFEFKDFDKPFEKSFNENKLFPKTTKNQDYGSSKSNQCFFKAIKTNEKPSSNTSSKHERIKSLDFNANKKLFGGGRGEDVDLLKKLHYQKVDLLNNDDVIFRIKEILDKNSDKNDEKAREKKKKVLDADVAYFKK